ncbi:AMP-binding protein [Sneathiella sp. HT1-7]|uniref:AMP-binding protein n=1 Tax=Sneathiella sp. HT1-7 TaxID=2887192 RepID=UPI001D152E2B|nr:AMP-binding protein [Sneathiella sp. HT1-7]MCC3306756.1 AMP-binding protein [Sneathiella sp. HT1-7]
MNELSHQSIVWEPSEELISQSNLVAFMKKHDISDYNSLFKRAEEEPEWWWNAIADRIRFIKPYEKILDTSRGIEFPEWFVGGTTNIVENSLSCHRGTEVWTSPAVLGESEGGETRIWTYEELSAEVSRLAAGLQSLGVQPGEVVAVYMPNVNEAVAALLAVPKIGAVVMPLFSGFGVDAVLARLTASEAVAILTVDGATRRGQTAPMKEVADAAAARAPSVRNVVCLRRTGHPVTMGETDVDWEGLCEGQPTDMPNAEMPAEAPALLVYTSGTSGQPKGTVHTHGGFPAKLSLDLGLMMDMKSSDRIVWFSDMGWLVGPLLAFGATLMGASFVIADGAPDYPDNTRMWRLIEKHRVTFLGVSPTLIRGFMHGAGVGDHDISSIRIVASTGEAWTSDAWWWTFENVLKRDGPIINYTGGTEIGGGILAGSVLRPMKACAFSGPVPGMGADIVDMDGKPVGPGNVGELVLRVPSIGLSRGLWKDNERYLSSYWRDIPGCWRQGDWAVRDEDGFWFVLGRSDDTLKIAGKRTGPSEIEALLTATGKVREAAAIGIPDEIKGESVACVVVLDKNIAAGVDVEKELSDAVIAGLGYPYKPKFILTVADLPKTRNMKVMRRLVRAVCLGKPLGDTSSLVNPEALDAISAAVVQSGHMVSAGDNL